MPIEPIQTIGFVITAKKYDNFTMPDRISGMDPTFV